MGGGGGYISETDYRYFIAHEVSFLNAQKHFRETRLAASSAAETGQAPPLREKRCLSPTPPRRSCFRSCKWRTRWFSLWWRLASGARNRKLLFSVRWCAPGSARSDRQLR